MIGLHSNYVDIIIWPLTSFRNLANSKACVSFCESTVLLAY